MVQMRMGQHYKVERATPEWQIRAKLSVDNRGIGAAVDQHGAPVRRPHVEMSALGTPLEIDIRGRTARADVVAEPFYKRPKA